MESTASATQTLDIAGRVRSVWYCQSQVNPNAYDIKRQTEGSLREVARHHGVVANCPFPRADRVQLHPSPSKIENWGPVKLKCRDLRWFLGFRGIAPGPRVGAAAHRHLCTDMYKSLHGKRGSFLGVSWDGMNGKRHRESLVTSCFQGRALGAEAVSE